MRKFFVAAALCAASVGAGAQTITDSVTGLVWLDLTPANRNPISNVLAANPGYELATSAQVAQFFTDEGLPSFQGSLPQYTPSWLFALYFGWGGGTLNYSGPVGIVSWFTAFDSGAPGTVGLGSITIDSAGGNQGSIGRYSVGPGGGDYSYPLSPDPLNVRAGFALVSVPAVPEPASWLLMAGGLLSVAHRRIRRRSFAL